MARKTKEVTAANTVRRIGRKSRNRYSGEEMIRIVLEGLRGEETVAELCRREGISESVYYCWSKEFLEAVKQKDPSKAGRLLDEHFDDVRGRIKLALEAVTTTMA